MKHFLGERSKDSESYCFIIKAIKRDKFIIINNNSLLRPVTYRFSFR